MLMIRECTAHKEFHSRSLQRPVFSAGATGFNGRPASSWEAVWQWSQRSARFPFPLPRATIANKKRKSRDFRLLAPEFLPRSKEVFRGAGGCYAGVLLDFEDEPLLHGRDLPLRASITAQSIFHRAATRKRRSPDPRSPEP